MKKIIVILAALSVGACSLNSQNSQSDSSESSILPSSAVSSSTSEHGQGVVNFVWEEPMVDVVDVPPGLDPEGMYYRPAHRAVVEVRQGRWQHYE